MSLITRSIKYKGVENAVHTATAFRRVMFRLSAAIWLASMQLQPEEL